jgi:hypothetical protein
MAGAISEYAIPALAPVGPADITAIGGRLVFDETGAAALGVVDPAVGGEPPLSDPPAIGAIEASLRAEARVALALPSAGRARRSGAFGMSLVSLEAGVLKLTWTAAPKRAAGRARARARIRIAAAGATFDGAGSQAIGVHLDGAARRLLVSGPRRRRLELTVDATFDGYWAGAVEVTAHRSL